MVSVLDCTLRDGGRIIDCAFKDATIKEMSYKMAEAKIDIVEVGFLRDWRDVTYSSNSTFFTDVEQIIPFVHKPNNTIFVAFIDFGMFDFESLKDFDGRSIDGIRVGFTKEDFSEQKTEIINCMNIVKEKGYKLFVQGVNSLAYTDKEMLEVIEMVNDVCPYSFGIVDTYGAMYPEDLSKIFTLIHGNMLKDVSIDFHSHNNYQMSFALAQQMISLAQGKRDIIIDATLNGMGKVAGNLNTELIIDYLLRKCNHDYEFNLICDLIDDYIYPFKDNYEWGYSIPSLMSGIYQCHPNNVIYLTSKFRLQSRDIKNLISMIEPQKRQSYDYDNIEQLYMEYCGTKLDDSQALSCIRNEMRGKKVLVLVPGKSLNVNSEQIEELSGDGEVVTVSVNFVADGSDYVFFGNKKRYFNSKNKREGKVCIVASNIEPDNSADLAVNYYDLINKGYKYFENSTMMLLYLLRRIGVEEIYLAGFDGFCSNLSDNYIDDSFQNDRHKGEFDQINREVSDMVEEYVRSVRYKCKITFLTPSIYENALYRGMEK